MKIEQQTIPLEELFSTYTEASQVKEATSSPTVPTGRYRFQALRADGRLASDSSPWPGRRMANIFGGVHNLETGKRAGSVGFDGSWEVHKTANGGLDKPSKLWGQLVKALDMTEKPVGEVIQAIPSYPFEAYVTEVFVDETASDPKEKWKTALSQEDREAFRKEGRSPRNFVQGIGKAS